MTHDERIQHCRQHHGFYCDHVGDRLFVFIPAGVDPQDGAPLHMMRMATANEAVLWEAGELNSLALMLRPPCGPSPLRRTSKWGRFLHGMRKAMGLGG